MALVLGVETLGVLALLVLQVMLPLLFGPGGLAAAALLDLTLFLAYRHRRTVRRTSPRYPQVTWGPVDRRYRTNRKDALGKEIVATFVLVVFLAGLYVAGWIVRIDALYIGPDIALYVFGSAVAMLAAYSLMGFTYGRAPWVPRFDLEDTTDDH